MRISDWSSDVCSSDLQAVACLTERLAHNPTSDVTHVLLAASYGHLGRIEEAQAAWRAALRANPDYSFEHRRKILPYKNRSAERRGGKEWVSTCKSRWLPYH